jgi:hypothetical protein
MHKPLEHVFATRSCGVHRPWMVHVVFCPHGRTALTCSYTIFLHVIHTCAHRACGSKTARNSPERGLREVTWITCQGRRTRNHTSPSLLRLAPGELCQEWL